MAPRLHSEPDTGVAAAVRAALAQADRDAYTRRPEKIDSFWTDAEAWGDE